MHFIQIFITVGLTSGVLYSIIVYSGIKRFRLDRDKIEVFLEEKIKRFGAPAIKNLIRPILLVYSFVYGESHGRRLLASLIIGLCVSLGALIFAYTEYQSSKDELTEEFSYLEQNTDPWLYSIATEEENKEVWARAKDYRIRMVFLFPGLEYVNSDNLSVKIRDHEDQFDLGLEQAIIQQPNSSELGMLLLFGGHYLNEIRDDSVFGNLIASFFILLSYNVFLDFIAASFILKLLSNHLAFVNFKNYLISSVKLILLSSFLFFIALLSYVIFFGGFSKIFLYLAGLTFSILVILAFVLFALEAPKGERLKTLGGCSFFLLLPGVAIFFVIDMTKRIFNGVYTLVFQGYPIFDISYPHLLASTTLIPLILCITCLLVIGALKLISEPLREAVKSFIGFTVEEAGSSHIAACVGILTFLTALIIAFAGA